MATAIRRFRVPVKLASALALMATMLAVSSAQAGIEVYYNYYQSNFDSYVGARHTLNQNIARSGTDGPGGRTCAGARDGYTYAFYGSFLCGDGYRCHPYAGGLLYPVLHNGEDFQIWNRGTMYYGSDYWTGSCG